MTVTEQHKPQPTSRGGVASAEVVFMSIYWVFGASRVQKKKHKIKKKKVLTYDKDNICALWNA
jgi:hypothetical protein